MYRVRVMNMMTRFTLKINLVDISSKHHNIYTQFLRLYKLLNMQVYQQYQCQYYYALNLATPLRERATSQD